MDTLTFKERIDLFAIEDLINKLRNHPNKYLIKLMAGVLDDIKDKIYKDESLSREQKRTYLDIIDDPDILDELHHQTQNYNNLTKQLESGKLNLPEKIAPSLEELLEGKVKMKNYLIYQIKPHLMENYQNLENKLLFY